MTDQTNGTDSEPATSTPEPVDSAPPSESGEVESSASEADALAAAQAEAERTRDQLLRTAADFDNFRKRSRREIADAERQAREDLLRDLLPVFDNLERALQHAKSVDDAAAIAQGLDLVMKQFHDSIAKLQVARIESVGQGFDPNVHEAIQQQETAEHAPGTITAEVQPGYRMGERLLRPALVIVAKPPASPGSSQQEA